MRVLPVVIFLCSVTVADTITMEDGTKLDGVYISENSSGYLVADLVTGKVTSTPKGKATVTISEDHLALGARWRDIKNPKKAAEPVTIDAPPQGQSKSRAQERAELYGAEVYKKDDGTVVIKHQGNYRPDPADEARIRLNKVERDRAQAIAIQRRDQQIAADAEARAQLIANQQEMAAYQAQLEERAAAEAKRDRLNLIVDLHKSKRESDLIESQIRANNAIADSHH